MTSAVTIPRLSQAIAVERFHYILYMLGFMEGLYWISCVLCSRFFRLVVYRTPIQRSRTAFDTQVNVLQWKNLMKAIKAAQLISERL